MLVIQCINCPQKLRIPANRKALEVKCPSCSTAWDWVNADLNISEIQYAKISQGDLYALLEVCSNDELDPLVEIITESLTNHLNINEKYKAYKPNHKKYHREIGDEIRLFGSDSFASLFRGGIGVSYDEIVIDVCSKLNIPHTNSTIENEKNILTLYELENKIIASPAIYSLSTFKLVASSLLTKLHPAGTIMALTQFSSPAFRVTIPLIFHISFLRKNKINSFKSNNNLGMSVAKKSDFFITNKNEENILTARTISNLQNEHFHASGVSKSEINNLNFLIQSVPNLTASAHINNTKYMEIKINNPLAKAADGNGFRGFARDKDGNIIEHVRLFDSKNLSKIVNFAAIYNVASLVVAQKHLADINQSLKNIEEKLNDISEFQTNERKSKIQGVIKYYSQITNNIIKNGGKPETSQLLEKNECNLLSIQEHILKDINDLLNRKSIEDTDTFGTESLAKSINNYQEKIHKLHSDFLLCLHARAYGWQLLASYSLDDDLLSPRLDDIKKTINLHNESHFNSIKQNTKDKVKKIDSFFNKEETLNQRKLQLLNKSEEIINNMIADIKNLKAELEAAEKFYEMKKNDEYTLALKIENNQVIEVGSFFRKSFIF